MKPSWSASMKRNASRVVLNFWIAFSAIRSQSSLITGGVSFTAGATTLGLSRAADSGSPGTVAAMVSLAWDAAALGDEGDHAACGSPAALPTTGRGASTWAAGSLGLMPRAVRLSCCFASPGGTRLRSRASEESHCDAAASASWAGLWVAPTWLARRRQLTAPSPEPLGVQDGARLALPPAAAARASAAVEEPTPIALRPAKPSDVLRGVYMLDLEG
mmetsp:Transcript_45703/g.121206  ORF Transcript_45703/g.121206 Transcript_45703/m.121206 type:complete len:217 (+) Transcript_45703:1441-2091(+)